ncbi:LysE family transporter [Streptomyces sp. NBC_01260]|uniref:LysE family transporter n=2 Tax=Streptomyces TaxID=1883 RepID=A0ABZ1G756_9ACTN|nr:MULTISPECIES: LysE family transporter [Streptomyces]ROQ65238.1 threonine/homoserine/homoserine lactone efflux protein [Streptomyces sp. CEV 2-1]WSC15121.1 LysE family transporter [Streptomyces brevispora]
MVTLLCATVLSCALVVLTPGPGVLMVLHIGASSGRRPSAFFVVGHLAGDLIWAALALIALRWVQLISPTFFTILTLASALYLAYLGARALVAAQAPQAVIALADSRVVLQGVAFGMTNPKSYPVTFAIFAAVLGDRVELLTVSTIPLFVAASALGCLAAGMLLAWFSGLGAVRRFYNKSAPRLGRGVALVFFAFAAWSLAHLIAPSA